jgi:hypothetical protein
MKVLFIEIYIENDWRRSGGLALCDIVGWDSRVPVGLRVNLL